MPYKWSRQPGSVACITNAMSPGRTIASDEKDMAEREEKKEHKKELK